MENTNLNIPIYRAKKECDGEYIEFKTYFEEDGKYRAIIKFAKQEVDGWLDSVYIPLTFRIDPTTLAIHFPDMLDSQGIKIFASLSKDGKGGDITELQASSGTCLSCGDKLPKILAVAIFEQMEFREIELNPHKCFRKRENNHMLIGNLKYKKVIGIQK